LKTFEAEKTIDPFFYFHFNSQSEKKVLLPPRSSDSYKYFSIFKKMNNANRNCFKSKQVVGLLFKLLKLIELTTTAAAAAAATTTTIS